MSVRCALLCASGTTHRIKGATSLRQRNSRRLSTGRLWWFGRRRLSTERLRWFGRRWRRQRSTNSSRRCQAYGAYSRLCADYLIIILFHRTAQIVNARVPAFRPSRTLVSRAAGQTGIVTTSRRVHRRCFAHRTPRHGRRMANWWQQPAGCTHTD